MFRGRPRTVPVLFVRSCSHIAAAMSNPLESLLGLGRAERLRLLSTLTTAQLAPPSASVLSCLADFSCAPGCLHQRLEPHHRRERDRRADPPAVRGGRLALG